MRKTLTEVTILNRTQAAALSDYARRIKKKQRIKIVKNIVVDLLFIGVFLAGISIMVAP